MSIITLTTDFGVRDWFVGCMKGVILGIDRKAQIVDLTHDIAPQDVLAGAFALASACPFFPKGTIHVAVVDPGVGSARAAIAVETKSFCFVGPDNGILSLALGTDQVKTIRQLTNPKYLLKEVSHTFHGRDIFAPVAAHLSRGVAPQELGPELKQFQRLALPMPSQERSAVVGAIIHIDRFGNAITNLRKEFLRRACLERVNVRVAGRKNSLPIRPCYQAVPGGNALGLFGSTGYLEIAVNGGNAAKKLKLKVGDLIRCEL